MAATTYIIEKIIFVLDSIHKNGQTGGLVAVSVGSAVGSVGASVSLA